MLALLALCTAVAATTPAALTCRQAFAALGLERGASLADIKAAFRREALVWHPDKNPGDAAAMARFVALGQAYAALLDDGRRAACERDMDGPPDPLGANLDLAAILKGFQVGWTR